MSLKCLRNYIFYHISKLFIQRTNLLILLSGELSVSLKIEFFNRVFLFIHDLKLIIIRTSKKLIPEGFPVAPKKARLREILLEAPPWASV